MAAGLAAATANSMADSAVGAYVQIHVGDPGAAGTANISGITTRQSIIWGTSSGGVKQATSQPAWTGMPSQQTITHISEWSASSGGTFKRSVPLASGVTVASGGGFTLASDQVTVGPVAA